MMYLPAINMNNETIEVDDENFNDSFSNYRGC